MKKLIYLIVLAVILGLVLTGCLLSNVGQVPATEQSGITYLTKGPLSINLVDLVGLWHFDENTGTTAFDTSGNLNANDGTIHGASWVSGLCGSALSFDGDDYVDCGPSVDDDITTGITLEALIKPTLKQNGGIVSNDITYISKDGYDFFLWNTGTYGRLYIDFGNGGTLGRTYWDIPDNDWYNQWHHVAATWNGSVIKLYADGLKVAEVNYIGTYSDPGKNTFIGAINLTPAYYNFDGIIDEVRIWDGALTAEQIEDSHYHGIVIQKGMSQDDAVLGDHVKITLEVVMAPGSVFVTDTLPDELRYIPGTFMVDGDSVEPTVVGQTISYTLAQPCAHTITFDAQVTSAEADDNTVINTATATATEQEEGVLASAELTIHPYEGFKKEVDDKYEDTKDGNVKVGELVQWVMTITVPNNFAWPISNATLSDRLGGELGMAGDGVDNNLNEEIDEGSPGDLALDYNTIPSGTLDILVRGKKANKVHFKITEIYIEAFKGSCFDLGIFTDKNPAGKQCYTTDGIYEMNSGAVLKFIDPDPDGPGFQLSAHTCPIQITVEP